MKWKIHPFIVISLMAMFLMGYVIGSIVQQSLFIKGAVEVAEGLEGTTFNIEIDVNETIMVDRLFELFNETLSSDNWKDSLQTCFNESDETWLESNCRKEVGG